MGNDKGSKPHFQAFLKRYIQASVIRRPCLGPKEWEEVQTIKQASTAQDIWATLVKAADLNVVSSRRKADPLNGRWSLEYSSQRRGSRNATICEIGQVIILPSISTNCLALIIYGSGFAVRPER